MRVWIVGDVSSAVRESAEALGATPVDASSAGEALARGAERDCLVLPAEPGRAPLDDVAAAARAGLDVVVVGALPEEEVIACFAAGAADVAATPLHKRELVLRLSAVVHRKLRVACLGGGTGLFTVLMALKELPRTLLSAIVAMSDDGGSSGRLRANFGVLPPGDVRRSLVALANAPEVMSFVMQYRFTSGEGLSGHSLGNLLLTALAELAGGSMQGAVRSLGDVLNVQGLVRCVTDRPTTLCAEFEDARVIRGESAIDRCLERPGHLRVRRVWHEPPAHTHADVVAALLAADVIVIGPGDLYTSVLAGLLVKGVPEAIRASRAARLYVCNLMTKPGETAGYDVADHAQAVVDALGDDALDYVVVSGTEHDPAAVASYAAQGQHPVAPSTAARMQAATSAAVVACDVGHHEELVRHDPAKLRAQIAALVHDRRPSVRAPITSARRR